MKMILLRQALKMAQYATIGIFLQTLFLGLLHASPGHAQKSIEQVQVSISNRPVTLVQLFQELESQTGFVFTYRKGDVEGIVHRATMEKAELSLASILRDVASHHGLLFKRVNQNISVRKAAGKMENPVWEPLLVEQLAQQTIIGVVKDATGVGLPGVSVIIKNTSMGTTTDIDGKFSLETPRNVVLQFSYIGFQTQEVEVGNRTSLEITMLEDARQLDEVVVVGYGTQKRSDLTGAISSVSEEQLKTMVTTSFDQALQGRVAGVQVTANSGQPGGGVSVRIRGASSINGSNEPLYVIDGIPVSGSAAGTASGFDWAGGGNGQSAVNVLSTINPADIVAIEVLKDASATAIYGSRAANGVIIVTTRRGRKGETRFNYDFSVGSQRPSRFLNVMDLPEFAAYTNDRLDEQGLDPIETLLDPSLLGRGTDWQREIFKPAGVVSHQLTVTGGSDNTTYAISGGYFNQDGIVIGSGFERFSLRLNVDNQTKKWLRIGNSMMLTRTEERITLNDDEGGVISTALTQSPLIPVRNLDGTFAGPTLENNSGVTNPVAMALDRDLRLRRNRLFTNLYAEINLLKGLRFRSEVGADLQFNNNYGFNPTFQYGTIINQRAASLRRNDQNLFLILKNYLTYDQKLGDRQQITFMAGHEVQQTQWEYLSATRQDFVANNIQELAAGDPTTATNNGGRGSAALESFFGRINYDFDSRYLLTFTMRADGSSKFGPANKWGYFPSAAAAWKLSSEKFFALPAVDLLKLRAGWGLVGNEAIPGYAYGAAMTARGTPFGTGFVPSNIPNPAVQWEASEQYNFGLDLAMLSGRVSLTFDAYQKNVDNLLIRLPMPSYMGGGSWMGISEPWVNAGKVENRGMELTLTTVNLQKGDFEWVSDFIFSRNRNQVKYLGGEIGVIFQNVQWFNTVTRTSEGHPMGMFYGFRTDGIFQNLEEIQAHPTQNSRIDRESGVYPGDIRFRDLNNDGVIDDNDREVIGDPNPDFTFGFNNHVRYKGFELTITTNGSYGNDIFNYLRRNTEAMSNIFVNQSATVNNRARLAMHDPASGMNNPANVYVANPGTNMPRASFTDPNNNRRISDRYVEDGSYWRIQNIILAYNLPKSLIGKIGLEGLKVYANLQNMYTFTRYTGFDPEIGAFNQNPLLQGVDNGRYPMPRIYTFGLNVNF